MNIWSFGTKFLVLIGGLLAANACAGTLTVQVTDFGSTGAPVSGVQVTLINFGNGAKTNGTADSRGVATFSNLQPGAFYVQLTRRDGSIVYFPNAKSISSATYTVVDTADRKSVAMNYCASQPPILDLWPTAASGEVTLGNPMSFSISVDNCLRSLSDLDLTKFSLRFDGLELRDFVLNLPVRNFVFQSSYAVAVNIPHVLVPSGRHTLTLSLANNGGPLAQTSRPINVQASKGFEIGFHTPPFEDYIGPLTDWQSELARVNQALGRTHTLVGYFTSWADQSKNYSAFNSFLNEQIAATGAVPVVTWEPWAANLGVNQPDYSLSNIIAGMHDAFITQFAQDTKKYGRPIILRTMHEFNGVYYPWAGPNNGNDPSLYVQAFRRIVGIFRTVGATNAEFMWSPNYTSDGRVPAASRNINSYYPGDDVVDWIGVSGYNWSSDTAVQGQGWLTFDQIFDSPTFDNFLSTMATSHPTKRVIIAEIGSGSSPGYSKEDWIRSAYASMANRPNVAGVVWFNNTAIHDAARVEVDFRVISAPGSDSALGRGPVTNSFTDAYRQAVQ